ncbi:MAG: sensor histidine kinase, partial [Candidatus Thermochlorobacter sp.]
VAAQEAGKTQLQKSFINLSEVIESVLHENLPNAQAKSQTLHLFVEPHIMAEVDAAKIRQVLDNLVSNAIKYSPFGKAITIRCEKRLDSHTEDFRHEPASQPAHTSQSKVLISVQDEGQGLSEDDLKRLFLKFQRLSARPTGGESSTGLGLSIAKHFVELHGGKIWAESAGKGKGATFFVELPISLNNQERFLPMH